MPKRIHQVERAQHYLIQHSTIWFSSFSSFSGYCYYAVFKINLTLFRSQRTSYYASEFPLVPTDQNFQQLVLWRTLLVPYDRWHGVSKELSVVATALKRVVWPRGHITLIFVYTGVHIQMDYTRLPWHYISITWTLHEHYMKFHSNYMKLRMITSRSTSQVYTWLHERPATDPSGVTENTWQPGYHANRKCSTAKSSRLSNTSASFVNFEINFICV